MKYARLSEDGLLLAVEDTRDDDWPHWAGPFDEIDNAPGRFVWDGETFMPVLAGMKQIGAVPSAEGALFHFLKAQQRAGARIPPATLKWMEFHAATMDAKEHSA
jgi:hypothetical protein